MKGIITWGSTYSKLNIDANLKVSDLNNSKVRIATNVGPILQIFTKKHHLGGALWAQPAAYAGQKEVPTRAENQHTAGKLVQLVQLVLPDPKFWRTHAALLFFLCFFFPLSFWGGLEVSSNRNPASPKKCQFIEAEEVLSSDLRMKAACGAAFFFLNLFPGVDLDERNFPPVIRKGSLKRHHFFLTLWQIWIKKYSNSIT